MLDAVRPFVHRAQVFGDELPRHSHAASARPHEAVAALGQPTHYQNVTAAPRSKRTMIWNLRQNILTAQPRPPLGHEPIARSPEPWLAPGAAAEPAPAAEEELSHERAAAGEEETDEEAAARYLWHHQHPAACGERRALVYAHDRAYWGFAANVHFMTVAFNYALAFNRTLINRGSDHWNYGGRDCRYGWQCYFQPVSHCTEQHVWEPSTVPVRLDHWCSDPKL